MWRKKHEYLGRKNAGCFSGRAAVPNVVRHLPYFIGSAIIVAAAAVLPFDNYILNILMQASTFAIAVFGLSVVLGLCGQINLAQAAFFGFGAYAVGLGTYDLHVNFWLCLVVGALVALMAGALLGMSTLRLGGHYLAMVTISFQQIVALIMINAIDFTHGPDGVSNIGRPGLFQSSHSYLGMCVAVLAIVGYIVWHLPGTRLGRAMRAVRDNELAASVAGINVYRTKVLRSRYPHCSAARWRACSQVDLPISAPINFPLLSRSCFSPWRCWAVSHRRSAR